MRNILLQGGPGTGKTIISRAMAYYVGKRGLAIDDVYSQDVHGDFLDIEDFVQSDRVEFIQIHPSMTYEDIVYGIEIRPSGNLTMAYAEKRVKQLCDRALGKTDLYFIILDDIGRANAGNLLGNLLYAMEYRNQPVNLGDGATLVIPDNVVIIMTECRTLYGNPLEYALRRRFDYEKELVSSREVVDKYYGAHFTASNPISNVFEAVCNFVNGHILRDPMIQKENYVPGHGMFLVERGGSQNDILVKVKQKFEYQVYPYLVDMQMSGILTATSQELERLYDFVINQINAGQIQTAGNSTVQKILYRAQRPVAWGRQDAFNYYTSVIIPGGCKEHRMIIECIVDAILSNQVFSVDKALSDILLNTNIVRFEHRTIRGTFAAFMVDADQNMNYVYMPTSANGFRSYYSSNACRTGRWKSCSDAPAYRVTRPNGTTTTYISLNAFRLAGSDTSTRSIHAYENAADIYPAVYHLIHAYLMAYESSLSLQVFADPTCADIHQLVVLEKRYWELKNAAAQNVGGADRKLIALASAVLKLKTLWNDKGDFVNVDQSKFADLVNGTTSLTIGSYEDLYNITGNAKSIEIKGVYTMVDLKDYQKIMESIGVRQMIFQGPPGTSKTFESSRFVLKQLNPAALGATALGPNLNVTREYISRALEPYKLTAADYNAPQNSSKIWTGGWDLVQFHPSYGYEDFIRGIEVKPIDGNPTYSSVDRILGKLADFAKTAERLGSDKPFYLIIDEINRANLATVFGELIYGLEYRGSKVSTPYEVKDSQGVISKDIVLGKNLFIIGTMNTADKSIDSIDYAIRRRFIFIDSPAQRDVILSCYKNCSGSNDENSIEALLFDAVGYLFEGDRFFNEEYQRSDVRIGHTYFLRHGQAGYIDEMAERFVFQVVPILREYVKDGIIDCFEQYDENSVESICVAAGQERIKKLGENIMLFVKHFGEQNDATGVTINNEHIANFIEALCGRLGW